MPSIIQSRVGSRGLSEDFSFREKRAVGLSGWSKGGKDEEVKLLEISLARCQKSLEELEFLSFCGLFFGVGVLPQILTDTFIDSEGW